MNAENDSTKHMTAYSTIIQGCRKDAPGAQAEFYDLHAQPLFLTALRLLNDEYEAEEAVQEVMLHVLTRKHLLIDTQADMARRMRRMVVNHCIDRLRKRRVRWEELDDKTPPPTPRRQTACSSERNRAACSGWPSARCQTSTAPC